jgi:hypothetical protein
MKLNSFTKCLSIAGRWMATALFFVSAIAFVWQGAFFANSAAMAAPHGTLIAADLGDQVKGKTMEETGRSKNFVRDTKNQLERTAKNNAERVEDALGDDDNAITRKAKRDADRIVQRSEEDASRTQKAIDNTRSGVKGIVDNIKDALD